ncbi:MAG: error-prone DNA polymerase [Proteobacteria bacterium]|nr:error-prone DNA polymerase [Pseudomonadota bacterium]
MSTAYAELASVTNFSFLRGGSHPDELILQAKILGLHALAVTDHNSFAGIVRSHAAAKSHDVKFVVGVRLKLSGPPDGQPTELLAWPTTRAAYGRLCRLLSLGQRRAGKGQCLLTLDDVCAFSQGTVFALPQAHAAHLPVIAEALRAPLYFAMACHLDGRDRARLAEGAALARRYKLPLLAINDVLYHHPGRRPLQDVLTCIREKTTLAEAGYRLEANSERHLKTPDEMARLFHAYPEAIANTVEIAEACRFSLDELRYEYPDEPIPSGTTPQAHLEQLTWEGAKERYPAGLPEKIRQDLDKELALISKLNYAPYFLTVYDIVRYARSLEPPILCQGRGSAANSAVCYMIGITSVDPSQIELLIDRFITEERQEPPDIDVDFEHERREEVIQYLYARYGREHAGLAATVITYRGRSAMREVGKVMGLSEDVTSALAGSVWGISPDGPKDKRLRDIGLDPGDELLDHALKLSTEIAGFPRHLSQHVGGFVLTRERLDETVPIGNAAMKDRTVIEWDKDDLTILGMLKVDVLGLGMLTCIRKALDLIEAWYGQCYTLWNIPREQKPVYDMLCKADSIGVFQVESRAQMNMLPRLRPRIFYDLVIEVAIVRPGPIQGNMVHPYLRRRQGLEKAEYPSPGGDGKNKNELQDILGRTLGVPLFQEQAMKLAMVAAKFTPSEINDLRFAMATFRRRGTIERLEEKMVSRMVARGYDPDFAQRCFNQIKGFGEYGFPESHAASFAHLVYVSAWIKCEYPSVFACALLNSQPMGFYAPAQIVRDAREHDVTALPPDVSHSEWDSTLEEEENPRRIPERKDTASKAWWRKPLALRLGLHQVDGLKEEDAKTIASFFRALPKANVPPVTILAGLRDEGISIASLEKLAAADCFRSLSLDRRQALWEIKGLSKSKPLPLFAHANVPDHGIEPPVQLPLMPLSEHVVNDYQTLRLSLKEHPMTFLRARCTENGVISNAQLTETRDGQSIAIAGVVLVRQRPGSANGVVFLTLEDEFSICNAVIWPDVLERYRAIVMGARLMMIRGRVQKADEITHVVAAHIEDRSHWLMTLTEDGTTMRSVLARADEVKKPGPDPGQHQRSSTRHPRNIRVIPKSRDFH